MSYAMNKNVQTSQAQNLRPEGKKAPELGLGEKREGLERACK